MAKKYYAVQKGLKPGVYETWDECKVQVHGYSGAKYKSFSSLEEARGFAMGIESVQSVQAKTANSSVAAKELPKHYAFVDGSFNENINCYGYGGFLCIDGKKYPLQGADNDAEMASMRNVAGEILGAMAAVKKAEELGISDIIIFYDYKGIEMWASGLWKTNKAGTKAYADFMKDASRSVKVSFQHVKGHSGIEGNELADAMAKASVGIVLTNKQQELYNQLNMEDEVGWER